MTITNKEILLVYRGGTAGIIPVISNEAQQLVEEGFQVTLFLLGDPDPTKLHQKISAVNLIQPILWSRNLPKCNWAWAVKYLELIVRIFIFALTHPAQLMVAHDIDVLPPVWLAARIRQCKLVYYAIELYAERPEVPCPWFWRFLDRFFAGKVDATISCQKDRTEFMRTEYGTTEPLLTVLNVPLWNPLLSNHQNELKNWLLKQNIQVQTVVLYQGILTPRRCIFELVEAAALLHPGIVIVLMGEMIPEWRKRFEEMVERNQVQNRIILFGYVLPEQLHAYTASADIGLVLQKNLGANTYFAAPIKLYQYLAAGLAVIGSDFPSLREVIDDPEYPVGLLADPDNPTEIAERINRLAGDESSLRSFRKNALYLAEKRYRYDLESKPLFDLYHDLIHQV